MTKQANTTVGDLELVFTGDVLSLDDNPIEIIFEGEPFDGKIIFSFEDDDDADEQDIQFGAKDDGETLEVKFKNFKPPIGGATLSENKQIGEVGDKKLLFNFLLRTIGNSRVLTYFLYLSGDADE